MQMHKKFHTWLSLHVTFNEKEPFTKFYGVFYNSSQNYEVTKL